MDTTIAERTVMAATIAPETIATFPRGPFEMLSDIRVVEDCGGTVVDEESEVDGGSEAASAVLKEEVDEDGNEEEEEDDDEEWWYIVRGYLEGGGEALRESRSVGAGAAKSNGVLVGDGRRKKGVVVAEGVRDDDADAELVGQG
ncbi:hypothetical protein MD484_g5501, partial [Candolleomyces efflorescens]